MPISDKRKCPKDKILNPSSKRCVSRKGKIGIELLKRKTKNYKRRESRTRQIQSIKRLEESFYDSLLGVKVLYDNKKLARGTIALKKEILKFFEKNSDIIPSIDASDKEYENSMLVMYNRYIDHVHSKNLKIINKKMKVNVEPDLNNFLLLSPLNEENRFGTLYYACNKKDIYNTYVIKIQYGSMKDGALQYESYVQKKANEFELSPKILHESHIKRKGMNGVVSIIIMDIVNDDLETLLSTYDMVNNTDKDDVLNFDTLKNIGNQILTIIEKFCKINLIHGDLHWKNLSVLWTKNGPEVKVIDFGQSTYGKPCKRKVELLQLLDKISFITKRDNRKYLKDLIYNYYIKKVGPLNIRYIGRKNQDVWDEYMENIHVVEKNKFLGAL